MKFEEKIKNKYLYSNKTNLLKIIYFFFQFLKSKFKPRLAYSNWGVDLIITNINKLLTRKKIINYYFSLGNSFPIFSCCKDSFFVLIFLSSNDSLLVLTA